MYLLFALIQCLLVVFVNGDVDKLQYEMYIEGGHYATGGVNVITSTYDYVMVEYDTITVTVETAEEYGYNITWKIIDKQRNPIIFKSERNILLNNVVKFKMWAEIPKNAESIEWCLVDSSSKRIVKRGLTRLIVLPKIEVASDEFGTWENGQKLAMENKIIIAKCRGGSSKDIQLDWVDTSGNLLIHSERIQIYIPLRKPNSSTWLYLNVTTDMEGVGCRVTNPTEGTTTAWYNFTVVYPPVATIISEIIPSNNCTEFTYEFFCSVKAVFPEKVIILIQRS